MHRDNLIKILLSVSEKVAMGNYRDADQLFALTDSDRYPQDISRLAEAFGMMIVKVEAREQHLEALIEDLRLGNIRLEELNQRLFDANIGMLETLGNAIAKRDNDTSSHNYRVTLYSISLAERMGIDIDSIRSLIKGAFLHDLGKIAISDKILLKPGKLNKGEFKVMKTHVSHGADIVGNYPWLHDCIDVVLYHHEKYNGKGYLKRLKGDEIPLNARIFCIADVFDALTSVRSYKEAFALDKTTDILTRERGSHFDPNVLDLFLSLSERLYLDYCKAELNILKVALSGFMEKYFSSRLKP